MEMWLSGRKRFFAKEVSLKRVPWVQIPSSPPSFLKPANARGFFYAYVLGAISSTDLELKTSTSLGVVIFRTGIDRYGAVKLFAQQHTSDLVRKSERRQGKQRISSRFHSGAQTIGSTNNEDCGLPL